MKNEIFSYDVVADFYYDKNLHPTCANFRELSKKFFQDHAHRLNRFLNEKSVVLETGCGMSLLMEEIEKTKLSSENVILQDLSEGMLNHSDRWANQVSKMQIGDARSTPFQDDLFQGVFSFLADPYNDSALWAELSRIIDRNGLWIMTTPSFNWAEKFRDPDSIGRSQFLVNGLFYDLPSNVYRNFIFIEKLNSIGFDLINYYSFSTDEINGYISPKLYSDNVSDAILEGYIFQKA